MIRYAKASSAGSTSGSGNSRGLFGRAFATRGASGDTNGRGAPSHAQTRLALALATVFTLALLIAPAVQAATPAHPFLEPFGEVAQPSFTNAASMAVDQSSGDLLVADSASQTLRRFHEDGTPSEFSALGSNTIDGLPGGLDETASGEILGNCCGATEVEVAVDNSGKATDGDIYATNSSAREIAIFNSAGESIGELTESSPGVTFGESCGVAVDEDGNVYVGSYSHNAVYKFANPPVDGASDLTIATTSPCAVAAAAGSVFATEYEGEVTKFDAVSGDEDYVVSPGGNTTVSIDPGSDHVLVATGEEIVEYHAGATHASVVSTTELESEATGAAVNGETGNLYAARSGSANIEAYGPLNYGAQNFKFKVLKNGSGSGTLECEVEGGPAEPCPETDTQYLEGTEIVLTATPAANSAFAGFSGGGCSTSPCTLTLAANATVTATFNQLPPTVVNNPAGTVTQTSAVLNGHVDNNGAPAGSTCFFEVALAGDPTFSSPVATQACAPTPVSGAANTAVTATATSLSPATDYLYRVRATNSGGTSTGEPAAAFTTLVAPPRISEQRPLDVEQTTATLSAKVNPSGLPTTYHFEWGTDTSYGNRIPVEGEESAGSGNQPVAVSADLSGLQSGTTYHFRLLATNSEGTTPGPDQPLETLNQNNLPNNRGYELVSPADKGTAGSLAEVISRQQHTQASTDGQSFMYPMQNGIDTSTAGGWLRELASRTPSGWLSTQISGPALIPPPRTEGEVALPSRLKYIAPDNSCGFIESYNPLSPDTPQTSVELGVTNLYRWNADGSYDLVTNRLPLNPELNPSGGYYEKVFGSEDCSRVYFSSKYEFISGGGGLYEWNEGTLHDASVRPDGTVGPKALLVAASTEPPQSAIFGGRITENLAGADRWNVVSRDGSRLFFTAISEGGHPDSGKPAVFLREYGVAGVVDVSQSQTAVPTRGARYEGASPDGRRVFFRANYGIAESSSAGPTTQACGPLDGETEYNSPQKLEPKSCDLYAYEVENPTTHLPKLIDLSADTNPADTNGAQIQGTIAIDEDGSHVYFAALGQLIPSKGSTYAQNTAGFGSANVYLAHDGQLSYVTTLAEHGPQPGDGSNTGDLLGTDGAALMREDEAWTANTTPDGSKLLFMSSLNLTGYDSGAVDKYEAYLYSADTGQLSCLSCRPDGLPSVALSRRQDIEGATVPAQSLLTLPRRQGEASRRSPSMSEDGSRIIFTSFDALAPGGVAGKQNVYEWQQGQVSFLATAEGAGKNGISGYQDMSVSGDDVFISTGEQLVPQDRDHLSDVYDVKVGGGFPNVTEPPECQVDESVALLPNQIYCQGDRTPQPASSSPASAGFAGPGNPPQSRSAPKRCPKGKVRRHGRCVKKHRAHRRKHIHKRAANANRGGVK